MANLIAQRVTQTLRGNSLVRFAKGFADKPTGALSGLASRFGFSASAKALRTGRVDDLAAAVGADTVGLMAAAGMRYANRALDRAAGKFIEIIKAIDRSDDAPAGDVMLILGDFAFMVGTAAHQSIARAHEWRWAQQDRLARLPAQQFVGAGQEKVTLEGYMLPHYAGGTEALQALRDQADNGLPLDLIDHYGKIFGRYCVTALEATGTHLDPTGQPRHITFRLSLTAYGGDDLWLFDSSAAPVDGISGEIA